MGNGHNDGKSRQQRSPGKIFSFFWSPLTDKWANLDRVPFLPDFRPSVTCHAAVQQTVKTITFSEQTQNVFQLVQLHFPLVALSSILFFSHRFPTNWQSQPSIFFCSCLCVYLILLCFGCAMYKKVKSGEVLENFFMERQREREDLCLITSRV